MFQICGWRNTSANPVPIAYAATRLPPLEDQLEDPVTAHSMQSRASLIMTGGYMSGGRAIKGINGNYLGRCKSVDVTDCF